MNDKRLLDRRRTPSPSLARLPPLTALRAFVASAKHLSFTAAADELHVTSAAIGQQVRLLEDHLGQSLFHRNRGQLELTATGRLLMPGLSEAFASLVESIAMLAENEPAVTIRISVSPSFASKWLVPRFDDLRNAAPHIEVLVEATTELADIEAEDVDCVIRYGPDVGSGLVVDRLFPEAVVPICSPEFYRKYGLNAGTHAALRAPLIHEHGPEHDTSCPDWNEWLRNEGLTTRPEAGGVRVNLSSLVVDAALAGKGLGLGKLRLCEADLATGRLVVPFGDPRPVYFSYYFAALPHKAKLPQVDLFRRWLRGQALALSSLERFLTPSTDPEPLGIVAE
ncbi:LysR substrate-binding domain-containing protein [Aquamicrobium sp. LC103]|uniref:LysR substrate-binding domain-containing protein n=1 Tax=Aquamicrobium sp. LC103 TaxID=1120658 RepID=UPI00063E960D|nr:LysR substrate-binding domain-containing protein [Aquamicrobium sp. LC103]TKT76302.1 LysR family transcriptional regulator [Aquamicrobium sp. LC103]